MIDFVIGVGSIMSALLLAAQLREGGRQDLLWSRLWFAGALATFAGYLLARELAGVWGFVFALIYTSALVALYPIQYLHVRSVTGAPARIVWPHVIAPLSNVLLILGLQFGADGNLDEGMVAVEADGRSLINFLTMLVIGVLAAYPLLALRRLWHARRTAAFRKGSRAAKRFDWLIAWCAATFLSVMGGWVSDLGSQFGVITIDAVVWVTFGALTVQLVLVGFFVTGSSLAFSPLPVASASRDEQDLETLTGVFQSDKPYLKSGISAEVLAETLGWTQTRLAAAIRAGGASHFNDYLNRWRVEEVMAQIRAGTDASILDLALDAGFGSKSSFNDAFKRHTGLTPSEFRRRQTASG